MAKIQGLIETLNSSWNTRMASNLDFNNVLNGYTRTIINEVIGDALIGKTLEEAYELWKRWPPIIISGLLRVQCLKN